MQPSPEITRFDPEAVSMLCSMGFAEGHVHAALKSFLSAARESAFSKRWRASTMLTNPPRVRPRKLMYRYPKWWALEKVTAFQFGPFLVFMLNFWSALYILLMHAWTQIFASLCLLERLHLNPGCKNRITSGVVCLAHEESKVTPFQTGIPKMAIWIHEIGPEVW